MANPICGADAPARTGERRGGGSYLLRAAATVFLVCAVLLGLQFLRGRLRQPADTPGQGDAGTAKAAYRSDGAGEPEESGAASRTGPASSEAPGSATSSSEASEASASDWRLLLVNPWNPLPGDFSVELAHLKNGQAVDERCLSDLQAMMDDCRAAGLTPLICSAYRTQEEQEALYNDKIDRLIAAGCPEGEAPTEAARTVAVPGTSEHQLGLALDIVDEHNQNLDSSQDGTAVQQWLMENSWRYGFILRYPSGKSALTGIIYEPWHYRYVGADAAKAIFDSGVCLEEYLHKAN